jgi:hypothetical protein
MTDHQPMPVKGYTSQNDGNVLLANEGKELEERVLRYLEKVDRNVVVMSMTNEEQGDRRRCIALAKTNTQDAFMWAIRGIFNPQRIKLPEDTP